MLISEPDGIGPSSEQQKNRIILKMMLLLFIFFFKSLIPIDYLFYQLPQLRDSTSVGFKKVA